MGVVFTAWDYDVTYLELSAFFVAIIAVWLASVGTRWAWRSTSYPLCSTHGFY